MINSRNIVFIILMLTFLLPGDLSASEIGVIAPEEVHPSSTFSVDVRIDTEDKDINAVSGSLIVQGANILGARTGDSLVNFWIEGPKVKENEVVFSGLIPGGIKGSDLGLFSVILKAPSSGRILLAVEGAEALIDDGEGTPDVVTRPETMIDVSSEALVTEEAEDTYSPEPFEIKLDRDNDLFDGDYFIVFSTTDKGTGVQYYEVAEITGNEPQNSDWVRAESPYRLEDQDLSSNIFVKAVDWSGNVKIENVKGKGVKEIDLLSRSWYVIILIIAIILSSIYYRRRRGK